MKILRQIVEGLEMRPNPKGFENLLAYIDHLETKYVSKKELARQEAIVKALDRILALFDPEWFEDYAHEHGGNSLWSAWHSGMEVQKRKVKKHQHSWETLPQRDRDLDNDIARDVLFDYFWHHRKEIEQAKEALADAGEVS